MIAVPRYYFDTSSIRSAGRQLADVCSKVHCCTSAFALFELVTQIEESEKEFGCRSSAIKNVLELYSQSRISIEWMLDMDRLRAAFPFVENRTEHIGTFYRVLQCAVDSNSIQEFNQLIASNQLSDYYKRLQQEHSNIVDVSRRICQDMGLRQSFDVIFEKNCPGEGEIDKRKKRRRTWELVFNYRAATWYRLIKTWAEFVADETRSDIQKTVSSYNQSLDLFTYAFGFTLLECQRDGRIAHENDFADLLHLMYLRPGDVLVSEEREKGLIIRSAKRTGITVQRIGNLL
jgi:hypothetical protein